MYRIFYIFSLLLDASRARKRVVSDLSIHYGRRRGRGRKVDKKSHERKQEKKKIKTGANDKDELMLDA